MVLHFDSLEALKQVFKEQEETEQAREKTKAEADKIKAERLKLEQRKQRHREQQDQERLKLLQEREQRAKAKEQQQANQIRQENKIYMLSLVLTFGSVIASVLLILVILLKYSFLQFQITPNISKFTMELIQEVGSFQTLIWNIIERISI